MLFIRGNAMSGAPNISGTSQFPNPPIMTGIPVTALRGLDGSRRLRLPDFMTLGT
jgi:hypothetical protein